jgi:hypothetical protein
VNAGESRGSVVVTVCNPIRITRDGRAGEFRVADATVHRTQTVLDALKHLDDRVAGNLTVLDLDAKSIDSLRDALDLLISLGQMIGDRIGTLRNPAKRLGASVRASDRRSVPDDGADSAGVVVLVGGADGVGTVGLCSHRDILPYTSTLYKRGIKKSVGFS